MVEIIRRLVVVLRRCLRERRLVLVRGLESWVLVLINWRLVLRYDSDKTWLLLLLRWLVDETWHISWLLRIESWTSCRWVLIVIRRRKKSRIRVVCGRLQRNWNCYILSIT